MNFKLYLKAWAVHKGRTTNPPDFKKYKGNFRCTLRKSESFMEVSDECNLKQQTGNYKVFKLLSREEVISKYLLLKFIVKLVVVPPAYDLVIVLYY